MLLPTGHEEKRRKFSVMEVIQSIEKSHEEGANSRSEMFAGS